MKSEKAFMAEQLRTQSFIIAIVMAGMSTLFTRYAFILDGSIRWVCVGLALLFAVIAYSEFRESRSWHQFSKVVDRE